MLVQEAVEAPPALDAEPRLERAGRIVQPTVDHLGIARGYPLAEGCLPLQHGDGPALAGQGMRGGQTHCAGAHDDGVEI